ncbi:MAG TPA: AGE family epimerase/isomerase [Candidatus Lustribacter sp.]|nr:AGE family epimerase/isomerase [Candidatus Lustribacter sp.]
MTPLSDSEHRAWLAAEAVRLVDFARESRHPDGGFAWLGSNGEPLLAKPVELWITARMTHVFALGQLLGLPGCEELVDHGIDALNGRLHDDRHGGWFTAVGSSAPIITDKEAYGHAFVVLAATSANAAGHPDAHWLLADALGVLDERFWDEPYGMVVDRCDETWATTDPYRGVNANMHTVEAYLAASDVTGDPGWRDRALRITERVLGYGAAGSWRLPEHFDTTWTPQLEYNRDHPADPFRPYGATVGHGLEWARLALALAEGLGEGAPATLRDGAVALFDRAVSDGWSVDGEPGLVYTTDWSGVPVVRQRMHWVAAEATATATVLHRATGDERYARWERLFWEHIRELFVDSAHGSWHHELDPANHPSASIWHGKPDVYHALQAVLLPRLPTTPSFATALAQGRLDMPE